MFTHLRIIAATGLVLLFLGVASLSFIYSPAQIENNLPAVCYEPQVQETFLSTLKVIVTTISKSRSTRDLTLRWNIAEVGEYYDRRLTAIASRFLNGKARGAVVDVDANIGWLSLYALAMRRIVYRYEKLVSRN